jgi:hypothetical protein
MKEFFVILIIQRTSAALNHGFGETTLLRDPDMLQVLNGSTESGRSRVKRFAAGFLSEQKHVKRMHIIQFL